MEMCEKEIKNQGLDNLMTFWSTKIKKNLSQFSEYQSIIMLIYEIENLIRKISQKTEEHNDYKMRFISKNSGPLFTKRNIFERDPPPGNAPYSQKNLDIIHKGNNKENIDNQDNILVNRLNSSNQIYTCKFLINFEEEENKSNTMNIQRNTKKCATIGGSSSYFESDFEYIVAKKDNNYITKIKKSKQYINFIDIDLFFQYIALGKKFFENEEDNKDLIEGFCLQYQTFIFPEILIDRVIKCFNFFYDKYLKKDNEIIEEKVEDEEEEKDHNAKAPDNNCAEEEKKNDDNDKNNKDNGENKDTNNNKKETIKTIPYGLVDFMSTFISIHNTYFHNELSRNAIERIYDFLIQLKENEEIMEKYESKIGLVEIELKEYESSIKTFRPRQTIALDKKNDNNSSSEEEGFNSEEDDDNNSLKKNLTQEISYSDSKINSNKSTTVNSSKFVNLFVNDKPTKSMTIAGTDEKKKKEKKKKSEKEQDDKNELYRFDIIKYKTQDLALELTRISYALYSKIKIQEFLKAVFNGKDKYKTSPHICQVINRFNALSSWVIEEILAYDHSDKRAEVLLKFIRICMTLKKIGNFDDCLSILTGLNNYNINKLDKTWAHIPPNEIIKFKGLNRFLSFDDNYKNMRDEISKRIGEGSFFIPYLGYYTKRLIYLEELGPYIKKNTSLINIEKIVEVYRILRNFYQMKNIKSCGHVIHDENVKKELVVLQCLDPSNEDSLTDTSNALEPKFILSNKKSNTKRRTKTDINFLSNINKYNIL